MKSFANCFNKNVNRTIVNQKQWMNTTTGATTAAATSIIK